MVERGGRCLLVRESVSLALYYELHKDYSVPPCLLAIVDDVCMYG